MMPADPGTIKGILFDKDGTLIRYDESWSDVNRNLALIAARGDGAFAHRLLVACGMDAQSGRILPDSLLAAGNTVQIAAGLVGAGADFAVEALTRELDALFTAATGSAVPVTDLKPFMSGLRAQGYRLGIASSDNENSIRDTVRRFGFMDEIDFIAGYDSGYGVKPEPGMVLAFCAAVGLQPRQVAVVGDNNHDLHMAANAQAGLKIGVLSGTGSRESLADADVCLMDITGIPALLSVTGKDAAILRPGLEPVRLKSLMP